MKIGLPTFRKFSIIKRRLETTLRRSVSHEPVQPLGVKRTQHQEH